MNANDKIFEKSPIVLASGGAASTPHPGRKSQAAKAQKAPIQPLAQEQNLEKSGKEKSTRVKTAQEIEADLETAQSPTDVSTSEPIAQLSTTPLEPLTSVEAEQAVGALPENAAAAWLPQGLGNLGALAALPLLALAGGGGGGSSAAPSSNGPIIAKSLSAALSTTSDSGIKGDNTTNDNTPTIRGVAAAGTKITLKIDQNGDGIADLIITAVADAEGNWEATPPQAMADGSYAVVITGVDPSGATTGPVAMPLTIDTTANTTVGKLDPASDSAIATDHITNDSTPTVKGNGTPGDTITVQVAGLTLTTTVAADGTWSATPTSALPDGVYAAVVTATDSAGNDSPPIDILVTVDTTIALAPVIDPSSDSNAKGDFTTSDDTPTVSGVGTPGDAIRVVSPTGEVLTTIVAADGTWSVTPTQALPEGGPQDFVITASDVAGNTVTQNLPVTIDNTPPASPLAKLDPASDTGVQGDSRTANPRPSVSGTGTPGDTITVTAPTGELLTTVVAADGTWSVTPTQPLPEGGPQDFSVIATDPAGNSSAPALVPVTIDTTAPLLTSLLNPASDSAAQGDFITSDNTPEISGKGTPGEIVVVTMPTGEVLQALVDASGDWTVTPTLPLPEGGPQNVLVTSTDKAGNSSSAPLAITIDSLATLAPTVLIGPDANNDAFLNAAELAGMTSIPITVTLPAGALAGDKIVINSNGVIQEIVLTQANVDAGNIAAQVARPAENALLEVLVKLVDPAGNASPEGTDQATIDTTSAGSISIVLTTDSSNDGVINAVELGGASKISTRVSLPVGAQVGDVLVIEDNVGNVRTYVLDAAMIAAQEVLATFPTPDENQTITLNAVLTDPAGNATPLVSDAASRDTFAPGAPLVKIVDDSNNDGYLNIADVGSKTTMAVNITLPTEVGLEASAGDTLHVTDGSTTIDYILLQSDIDSGTVAVSFPMPTNGSTVTVSAHITDPGLNPSPTATDVATVDTQALAAPTVTILEDVDNNGFINISELSDQVDVRVGLPAGSAVGDTLRVTDNAGNVRNVTLTSELVSAGVIDVSFPASTHGSTFSVTAAVTDEAGNLGATSPADSAQIDTSAPAAVAAALTQATDSGAQGDSRTSNPLPGVTGTGTPGDTIRVVSPVGEVMTTIVAPDGTWSVLTTQALPEGGPQNFSVAATDPAGNPGPTSTVPVTIDTTAPSPLTALLDPLSDSGVAGDSTTSLRTPNLTGVGEAGANISVVVAGQTLNTVVAADGTWSVTPTTLVDGPYSAVVTQTDAAGNSASTGVSFTVDNSAPVASIVPNSITGDDLINISESTSKPGAITGTISGEFQAGDIVTLKVNGVDYSGPVNAAGEYSINVPGNVLAADPDRVMEVSAVVHDAAGNSATISTTKPYSVDIIAPVVSIAPNPVTADDVINIVEGSAATVALTGTVTGEFKVGDIVTLTVNGVNYTGPVDVSGNYSIDVPGSGLAADPSSQVAISFTTTDAASNSTILTTIDPYTVDTAAPLVAIALNAVTADNIVNISEGAATAVPITGSVSGEFKVGDTVSIVVNGKTFTGPVNALGAFSIEVPGSDLLADADTTIAASLTTTDAAGNSSTVNETQAYGKDTVAPIASINLNDVTADNVVNIAEGASGAVPISGTVAGQFNVGDIVSLVVNGNTYFGAVDANGNFTINVPGADLLADIDTVLDASLITADAAGNSSTITDTQAYAQDTAAPALSISIDSITSDNVINAAESASPITVTGVVSGEFKAGDVVTLSINGNPYTTTIDASGNFSVTVAPADLLADPDKSIAASVTSVDAAGNIGSVSISKAYAVDITPPGTPTVIIADDLDNDGDLNASEHPSPGSVNVVVNLPTTNPLVAGDKLTVTSNTGTTTVITVSANDILNGSVSLTVAAPTNGTTLEVSASATDAAGNTSGTSTDNALLDTVVVPITVELTSDSNNNEIINRAELGSATTVGVRVSFDPALAQVGDQIQVSDNFGNTRSYTLSATDVANGYVVSSFPKPNEDQTLVVNATILDSVGNSSSAPADQALIDTLPPGTPTVQILNDTNNNGYISTSESAATATARVSLPAAPAPGDTSYAPPVVGDVITLYAANGTTVLGTATVDATSLANGYVDFTGLSLPADGSTYEVLARLTDTASNDDPGWDAGTPGNDSAIIDLTAPTVAITRSGSGDKLSGATETITFTLSEASTNFSLADIVVSGGTLSGFSGSGTTYTATLTIANADTSISVGNGVFSDAAGNSNADALDADNNLVVNAANDAPVNTKPASFSGIEDQVSYLMGLSVTDVDAGSTSMTVTLTVTNGTLNVVGGSAIISGNGTTSVTLTGTLAEINSTLSALNSVAFTPTENFNGTATLNINTSDNGGVGSGGPATSNDVVNINIASVNDAPVTNTVTASANEDASSIPLALGGTDVDGTIASAKVTSLPLASQGVLYLAGGTTAVTTAMDLTPAQMAGLVFKPTANFNGTVNIPFTVTDNLGLVSSATNAMITVNAVNDAPVLTLPVNNIVTNGSFESGGTGWTGNSGVETSFGFAAYGLSSAAQGTKVLEVEGGGLSPNTTRSYVEQIITTIPGETYTYAFQAITRLNLTTGDKGTLTANGVDLLSFTTGNTWGSYAASFVATGTSTAIRIYSDGSVAGPASKPGDGSGLIVDDVVVSSTYNTYLEGGPAKPLIANSATLADVDDVNLESASIVLNNAQANDQLLVNGSYATSGTLASGITWTRTGMTVDFSGSASTADYLAALKLVQFENSDENNSPTVARTFTATANDGDLSSVIATGKLYVQAINDAPLANAVTLSVLEDTTTVPVSLSGSDVDGTIATGQVSSLPTVAQGVLYKADGLTAVTTAMVLTSAELAGLVFKPAANYNGVVSIDYTVTDNQGLVSSSANATINVTAVNDAPTWTNPTAVSVGEQGTTTLNGRGLVISDVDASSAVMTLTMTSSNGGVTVAAGASGVSIVSGNGTGSVVVQGTMAQLDALLASSGANGTITYAQAPFTPLVNEGITSATINFSVSDQGNTGSGGELTASKDLVVSITPVSSATVGGSALNTLYGGGAADMLIGGGNADSLYGGSGDDVIIGDGGYIRNGSFEFWTGATLANTTTSGSGDYTLTGTSIQPGITFNNFAGVGANAYLGSWSAAAIPSTAKEWVNGTASVPYQAGFLVADVGVSSTVKGGATFSKIWAGAGETYDLKFLLTDKDIGTAVGENWQVVWNGATIATISNTGVVTITAAGTSAGITGSSVSLGDIDNTANTNIMRDYTLTGLTTVASGSNTVSIEQVTGAANARDLDFVRMIGSGGGVGGIDILDGGTGNDSLFGGVGNDNMTGGAGTDTFVISAGFNNGNDTITDFAVGTDKLQLVDLLALANAAAQVPSKVASPTITLSDLISTVATGIAGHAGADQTVTWNDASKTLSFGWGGSVTFQGMTNSYTSASAFLTANGILSADGFQAQGW
jgi:large repetitive protein